MSKLSVAFASFSLTNPVQSIETGISNLIKSVKPDVATAMEPELDTAVNGSIALAMKFLKIYAFAKAETLLKEFLGYVATKRPALAPDLNAVIAKLPA